MAIGVLGSRAELNNILMSLIFKNNFKKCRATILTAADFQNTLKPQDWLLLLYFFMARHELSFLLQVQQSSHF